MHCTANQGVYQTPANIVASSELSHCTQLAMSGSDPEGYKVVLVGDVDVGKTSLFNYFKLGKFVEDEGEGQSRRDAEHAKTWQYEGEELAVRV